MAIPLPMQHLFSRLFRPFDHSGDGRAGLILRASIRLDH